MNARSLSWLLVVGCAAGCARLGVVRSPAPDYDRYSSAQHSDFGVVYEQGGNLVEARRQYEWAVKKSATNHVAWANLGNVAARMGDPGTAHRAWMRALEICPGYGPAVLNRAAMLSATNAVAGRQWLGEQQPLMEEPWRGQAGAWLSEPAE